MMTCPSVSKGSTMVAQDAIDRAPTEKPPFTLGQIKKAIPPHCFNRSVLRSFSYLFFDLTVVFALLYLALYQIPSLPSPYHFLAWPLYWLCQFPFFAAIWVIAHECGHHAFSDYQLLDDTVGFILHTSLLNPYFSWKISHRHHHNNTASVKLDHGLAVPKLKSTLPWFYKNLDNPLNPLFFLFAFVPMGWPMFLAFNFYSRPYPRFASIYDPFGPTFSNREHTQVFVSNAGLLIVFYALYRLAMEFSFMWVIRVYGIPILLMNGAVVVAVYLHHTHPSLPRYDSSEWDWLRGALATVDREYSILDKIAHNIASTHVVHHLFPMLPHYNAAEATEAIKPVLGEYYRSDSTHVFKALWREAKECVYVEPEGVKRKGVYWFSKKV